MLQAVRTVVKENIQNYKRMFHLARYDAKKQNSGTTLGFFWNFLNPALQIFVYWFVFAIGLRSQAPKGDFPYIIWMIVGIIPWFYISAALMSSTTAIFTYSGVLKRIALPLSIVPVKTVVSSLITHFWSMLVVIAILIFLTPGFHVTLNTLWLFYYMVCSFAFLIGYALLASAITVLFRDFQKIMTSVIRLLFYISPVLWVPDKLDSKLQFVLSLNPFAYIVNGYRDSLLYGAPLWWHWHQGVYFWAVTILLFGVGCSVHMRFRKQFLDLV